MECDRRFVTRVRYTCSMTDRRVITPDEMDRMTADERAAAVGAGTVLSLDELPGEFRQRVVDRAEMLSQRIRTGAGK
jgi:hypothetical protein